MRRVAGILIVLFLTVGAVRAAPAAGADTGVPTCTPGALGTPFVAPGPGVKTTGLGAGAPAYYEIGAPTGAFAGVAPKGIMLVLHGGGWRVVGKETLVPIRGYVDRWRARGWQTVSVDYRACAQGLKDVFWFMQRIRVMRPNALVCATGMSAGGHMALMLASFRKDLACVIALAAPSNLNSLADQVAFDPLTQTFGQTGPTAVLNLARATFGDSETSLDMYSPATYAQNVTARVLLASGENDKVNPREQNAEYSAALLAAHPAAYIDTALLPPGLEPFVHTGVSAAGLDDLYTRENALVAPLFG